MILGKRMVNLWFLNYLDKGRFRSYVYKILTTEIDISGKKLFILIFKKI